ncbi:hypothetical protein FRB99_002749 [Tulasnella sp. 403]|nr:hypothetical protein FRB99_002749 [Tulasnella sp. 403]
MNEVVEQAAIAAYTKDPHGVLGPWIFGTVLDSFFIGLLLMQRLLITTIGSHETPDGPRGW